MLFVSLPLSLSFKGAESVSFFRSGDGIDILVGYDYDDNIVDDDDDDDDGGGGGDDDDDDYDDS